jgi:hypothetical protein
MQVEIRRYYNYHPSEDGGQAPFSAGGLQGAIIYNITTQVAWQFHEEWLQWMLDVHVPEVLGTGCFIKHQLVRILETDERDGPVYAVQYYAVTIDEYNRFITFYGAAFAVRENEKWGNAIFNFSSLMAVVD